MTRPYADSSIGHHRAGWSPLPIPSRSKKLTIKGVSGYAGRYVSEGEVVFWSGAHPDWNIALRFPPDVAGLDLDVYRGGGETLAKLEEKFGPLPPTVASTSRTDGSGILLFRIPVGTILEANPGGGIEVIQASHRYAMVPGSIHPEGRPYRWVDTASGEILDESCIPSRGTSPTCPGRGSRA